MSPPGQLTYPAGDLDETEFAGHLDPVAADHPRTGPGTWCTYYYWLDDDLAPGPARPARKGRGGQGAGPQEAGHALPAGRRPAGPRPGEVFGTPAATEVKSLLPRLAGIG